MLRSCTFALLSPFLLIVIYRRNDGHVPFSSSVLLCSLGAA
jgi:hypothetical protein